MQLIFQINTYQLNDGEILFPPQIFAHVWPNGGESIIGIHDHMDKTIDHCASERATSWHKFGAHPPKCKHGAVMIDVKEGELILLFAQNEEECVTKFQTLAEIVPPNGLGNADFIFIVRTIHQLTHEIVLSLIGAV